MRRRTRQVPRADGNDQPDRPGDRATLRRPQPADPGQTRLPGQL